MPKPPNQILPITVKIGWFVFMIHTPCISAISRDWIWMSDFLTWVLRNLVDHKLKSFLAGKFGFMIHLCFRIRTADCFCNNENRQTQTRNNQGKQRKNKKETTPQNTQHTHAHTHTHTHTHTHAHAHAHAHARKQLVSQNPQKHIFQNPSLLLFSCVVYFSFSFSLC